MTTLVVPTVYTVETQPPGHALHEPGDHDNPATYAPDLTLVLLVFVIGTSEVVVRVWRR